MSKFPSLLWEIMSFTKHFYYLAFCYCISYLSHLKWGLSCLSNYTHVQVDKSLHKGGYKMTFKHSSTMNIFKVRLDFFFLNKVKKNLKKFGYFSYLTCCTLRISIKDLHSHKASEGWTASCPNKVIGTENWFHKLHLKLHLWVVFLHIAILTPHAVFAQSPNKPMLFLLQMYSSIPIFFSKKASSFYSALFSNQKKTKMCRNFKNREKQIWHASNYSCPSSTLTADPSDLLFAAMLHQNHHSTCFHKNKGILFPIALPLCAGGEELKFLIHYKDRKSRVCSKQSQSQQQRD